MKSKLTVIVLCYFFIFNNLSAQQTIEPSHFKLSTSNGLLSAVYDTKKNVVEYVYPHLFALIDSGVHVSPFMGNIKLNSNMKPNQLRYNNNTHIITADYDEFTVNYFSSFINEDKIFYVVIRGEKPEIEKFSLTFESGNGKVLTDVRMLTTSHDDLSVTTRGKVYSDSLLKQTGKTYEKYFLYSFTDSLHTDKAIVSNARAKLKEMSGSLLDNEISFMRKLISSCSIPQNLSEKEKNTAEQSVTFLKMSQVSDKEIFPFSHGQIMASLRPGLWHSAWVRDGSYAIRAMTELGMYEEARKGLEFMLKAPSGNYVHYIYKDGKDYGVGSEYQISVCRYYGNGKEESTQFGDGPNFEYDNFGLFLWAFSDYVIESKDSGFFNKWKELVRTKIADVTLSLIEKNSLIREDSGPWEHYLQMPKQYTFTSGVCAAGLSHYAGLQKQFNEPYKKYEVAAEKLKRGLTENMLIDNSYFKGNANNKTETEYEYYDAGVFEIFANEVIDDKNIFLSHMEEYDKVLQLPGVRPGYIRLSSNDPYENQEWVFINLRIALAHLLFGQKDEAAKLLNHVTEQAALNYNTIPEMYSNKVQSGKVTDYFKSHDVWCNCIRDKDGLFIGAIPMVGYGSGAYILTLLKYYND